MSGIEGLNGAAFADAASSLRAAGFDVVSPAEVHHPGETGPGSLPWVDYLRTDLRAMLECDAIVLLPGWRASDGARLELRTAVSLGFQVFYYGARGRLESVVAGVAV